MYNRRRASGIRRQEKGARNYTNPLLGGARGGLNERKINKILFN